MAIANGTCVSFCNQHISYLRESRRYVIAFTRFAGYLKAHFGLPWLRPWDNRGNCYMDEKRIQCLSNASQHVLIYLQPFTSYSEILIGNCKFFLPPCI